MSYKYSRHELDDTIFFGWMGLIVVTGLIALCLPNGTSWQGGFLAASGLLFVVPILLFLAFLALLLLVFFVASVMEAFSTIFFSVCGVVANLWRRLWARS